MHLLGQEREELGLNRIRLVVYGGLYICSFLTPQSNRCRIYSRRPFECRLYPFLLNRRADRFYLSVSLSCPFIRERVDSKDFRGYTDYLVHYLQTPAVSSILGSNRKVFSSYPREEVLNLAELSI